MLELMERVRRLRLLELSIISSGPTDASATGIICHNSTLQFKQWKTRTILKSIRTWSRVFNNRLIRSRIGDRRRKCWSQFQIYRAEALDILLRRIFEWTQKLKLDRDGVAEKTEWESAIERVFGTPPLLRSYVGLEEQLLQIFPADCLTF